MARIWIRVIKHHRIASQATFPCTWDSVEDEFNEAVRTMDIARPLWLTKHDNEMENFRRTAFTAEHFVEEIDFDRLEVEFLDDTDKKRKSNDPRNQF